MYSTSQMQRCLHHLISAGHMPLTQECQIKQSIQFIRTVLAASVVKDLPSVWSKPCTFEGSSALFCRTCNFPAPWLRGADNTQGRHEGTGKYCMNSDSRELWG